MEPVDPRIAIFFFIMEINLNYIKGTKRRNLNTVPWLPLRIQVIFKLENTPLSTAKQNFLRNKLFKIKQLDSERDINFILSINNKKKYVLKISNPSEKKNILKYQDRLINYLRSDLSLKSFIPKIHHTKIVKYFDIALQK